MRKNRRCSRGPISTAFQTVSTFRRFVRTIAVWRATSWRVPHNHKVLLFAPHWAKQNPRKGTDVLMSALRLLGPRDDIVLLIAGVGAETWIGQVPQRVNALGYLRDDRLIALANAAADCVVIPSATENLPNGVIEAFACARPVIAFDAGGLHDAVRSGETGILVPAGDAAALAQAIDRMLERRGFMSDAAARRRSIGQARIFCRTRSTAL